MPTVLASLWSRGSDDKPAGVVRVPQCLDSEIRMQIGPMWRQQAIVEVLQFRLHAEREHFWGAQGESKRRVRHGSLVPRSDSANRRRRSGSRARLSTRGASTQHAYEELRRQILQGELAPGATFSQVQLSDQLGVSRTPLREAVRLLQMEGLLRAEPRRRVRVSPLSTEDFEDLYAIRIALESLAVRLTVPQLDQTELANTKLRAPRVVCRSERGRPGGLP